jgi:hypothetical protein
VPIQIDNFDGRSGHFDDGEHGRCWLAGGSPMPKSDFAIEIIDLTDVPD